MTQADTDMVPENKGRLYIFNIRSDIRRDTVL